MKKSSTQIKIIETASRLFYKKGYNLTGINEIISEAGIAKATLYSHFRSKDDICVAYLNFRNTAFLKDIKAYLNKKTKGNPQIVGIFEFLELFYNDQNFNGCWCINTVAEIPKENEKIRSLIQSQKKSFLKYIVQVVKDNLPEKNTSQQEKLAQRIYLLYEGALTECHIHREAWPIAAAKDLCIQLLA